MAAWTNGINDDGLRVKFGTDQGTTGKAGEYSVDGPRLTKRWTIDDMSALGSSAAILTGHHETVIPANARITKVILTVEDACTGTSSTLNVGLKRQSDFSTEVDHDGLIAAGALATMDAAGDIVEYTQGSTGHGALIGTTLAYNSVLVAYYGTAFTAGKVYVDVEYYMTA